MRKESAKAGGSRRFPRTDQLTSSVGGSTAITQVPYAFALEDLQESVAHSSTCHIHSVLLLSRLLDNIRSREESGSASLTCIFNHIYIFLDNDLNFNMLDSF